MAQNTVEKSSALVFDPALRARESYDRIVASRHSQHRHVSSRGSSNRSNHERLDEDNDAMSQRSSDGESVVIEDPAGEPIRNNQQNPTEPNTSNGNADGLTSNPAYSISSPDTRTHDQRSIAETTDTYETGATSIHTLPALQAKGPPNGLDHLEPVIEDDPASYDLVIPDDRVYKKFSLEERGEQIFSTEHLSYIFKNPELLLKFTAFLGKYRPESVPILIYYLDALKALRAIKYSNAVAEALEPLSGHDFTRNAPQSTANAALEEKARQAFDVLVQEDLPAYVTHIFISVVSKSIHQRITGQLPPHLREASEGLAEVFCLTDPSREDNPIVFASEEFHRTTQYGMEYAIGRNCRFLQGPRTNKRTVRRISEALKAGRDSCETFVNYRRDGSPFLNLLTMAPLRDSRGRLRYFIGAQCDVSGLAKECSELEALQKMLADKNEQNGGDESQKKDEFEELSEMFNLAELDTVRKSGGKMHREHVEGGDDNSSTWHRPRLLLKDQSPEREKQLQGDMELPKHIHGKLSGVFQHWVLVRPYPSLRILFTSPSLRVPGILQSPLMNRIGSSERVREELVAALAEGRGVTAKVRWMSKQGEEGRSRWMHCTPLLGQNGDVGVYMIVLVDDDASRSSRKFRQAPPVAADIRAQNPDSNDRRRRRPSVGSQNSYRASRPGTSLSQRGQTPSVDGGSEYDYNIR